MTTPALDGLVCDLDGVLYRGVEPIPGAAEAIHRLRSSGIKVVFATNNATKTLAQYVERLRRFDVEIEPDEIVTSAVVTGEEIDRRGWSGRTAFLIGADGMEAALQSAGVVLVGGVEARTADIAVVSSTATFDYQSLATAAFAVRNGAEFVASNADPTFPGTDGLWPGAGAMLAAVETASGRRAEVMGKPHPPMMEAIARRLPDCKKIAVVGDQPATDLEGGHAMGWMTILVLSGVTDEAASASVQPAPDLVIPSLVDLLEHVGLE